MARTLGTLRGELEAKLNISGATYDFWSEANLNQYINEAIRAIVRFGNPKLYQNLLTVSSSFVISSNNVTPSEEIVKWAKPFNFTADGETVKVVTPDELRVYERNSYQEPSTTNVYVIIHDTRLQIFPAPSSVTGVYYVQPTALTGDANLSLLSQDGDDYALQYAYGEALVKGQADIANGMAIQEKVKEQIR